jgi:NADP-dependent 3-hydroxy acid dehydrogenase YdfG
MKRLDGKIAVVTGGSSGIGFATAKAFVKEGATVYITGRRKEALEAAAAKIGEGCIRLLETLPNKRTSRSSTNRFAPVTVE